MDFSGLAGDKWSDNLERGFGPTPSSSGPRNDQHQTSRTKKPRRCSQVAYPNQSGDQPECTGSKNWRQSRTNQLAAGIILDRTLFRLLRSSFVSGQDGARGPASVQAAS